MRFVLPLFALSLTTGCAGGGDAGSDALTCDVVAKHVVDVLHGELGDDSFLKPEHVGDLTAGCKKAGNLESDPNAACIAKAKSIADMDGCGKKAVDNLIKPWMK